MNREEVVRRYYETIDEGDYESLAALLDPAFTHRRPDRTLAGRETFVRFMREDRPRTDTAHAVDGVYLPADGNGDPSDAAGPDEVVVRGRLRTEDGRDLFGFVDVFRTEDDLVRDLRTYTGSLSDG